MIALGELVWAEPIVEEPVTSSGVITAVFTPRPTKGRVTHIGKHCDTKHIGDLKVGDIIIFNPDHYTKRNIDGKDYITIPDRNVMGIIPDEYLDLEVEDHEI